MLSTSVRHFSVSSTRMPRHWWDTLKDDDDLDKRFRDPLYTKGSSNPKPYELELEMRAYRLEQEEKYQKFRPLILLYVTVGTVAGYFTNESIRESRKAQRRTKWMTPAAADKLTPGIRAASAVGMIFILEFIECCGTLGCHYPVWTLGSFALAYFIKMLYHESDKYLD